MTLLSAAQVEIQQILFKYNYFFFQYEGGQKL